MMRDIQQDVLDIIEDVTGKAVPAEDIDKAIVGLNRILDDLIIMCEEEFGISLPYEDITELTTPKQLITIVEEKVRAQEEEDEGE